MKCLTRRIEVENWSGKKIGIFCFADLHLGSVATDEDKIERDIAGVKERGDYWIDLGDSLESINRKDKRHKEENLASWLWGKTDIISIQMDRYKELFADIRPQCLTKLKGNHEESVLVYGERDIQYELVAWIKDGIGDDSIHINGGLQTHIRLSFLGYPKKGGFGASSLLKIFTGHGYGGGRKAGAGPLSLEALLGIHNVDVMFTGHRHTPSYYECVQLDSNKGGKLFERYRIAFVVPSYRSKLLNEGNGADIAIPDYSDLKLLPPSATGGVRIEFRVDENRVVNPFRPWE